MYAYVGAPNGALELEYHEEAVASGYSLGATTLLAWLSPYAEVRKTERFKAFARKAGFVDCWRARGRPDLCRPVGVDDFVCD
jgi:hypothetical protein